VFAGVGGGYLLANWFAIAFMGLVPMQPRDASLTANMLAFLVATGAVIWAFAARSTVRAWVGVAVPTLICGALILIGSAIGGASS
jgi:hypothetical protein